MNTKGNLLALLENNLGQYISGEEIADNLGISRNAIWKAANALRKDGYIIEAKSNKGYRLSSIAPLTLAGIQNYLRQDADISVFSSLNSTNTTAKQMAVEGAKHGTVIIADHQTGGYGRYGRRFYSPKGCGIYMSFVLRPEEWLAEPALITAYSAVAVCRAVETVALTLKPAIKWVNDIFLHGKKFCGISAEAVSDMQSGGIGWVVVGIGVNFTYPPEGVPQELADIIGAVFPDGTGDPPTTRNRLAAEVINNMLAAKTANLIAEYKQRLFMLGKNVTVTNNYTGEAFEATAIDIDSQARLIVKKENGEVASLSSGEISLGIHSCG